MPTIEQTAKYVRSKNAGPFWITIDIVCGTDESYNQIMRSESLKAHNVARIYGADLEKVKIFLVKNLRVIKISIPRSAPQGSRYERDMHGGQQYPLLSSQPV
jgi:hypothetical protein